MSPKLGLIFVFARFLYMSNWIAGLIGQKGWYTKIIAAFGIPQKNGSKELHDWMDRNLTC
jgi:hypothetical protein